MMPRSLLAVLGAALLGLVPTLTTIATCAAVAALRGFQFN